MTVFALCKDPKVDWLTDGKRYEVLQDQGDRFSVISDTGSKIWPYWGDVISSTWTRIVEPSEPPLWALDKAAKAAGWNSFKHFLGYRAHPEKTVNSIEAHAATLAEYETEPVDEVLLKARAIHANQLTLAEHSLLAEQTLAGEYDCRPSIKSIMEALRLPAMGADQ